MTPRSSSTASSGACGARSLTSSAMRAPATRAGSARPASASAQRLTRARAALVLFQPRGRLGVAADDAAQHLARLLRSVRVAFHDVERHARAGAERRELLARQRELEDVLARTGHLHRTNRSRMWKGPRNA